MKTSFSRRQFLKSGAAATALAGVAPIGHLQTVEDLATDKTTIKLGVASYSLRKFNLKEAIDMTVALKAKYIKNWMSCWRERLGQALKFSTLQIPSFTCCTKACLDSLQRRS